MTSRIAVGRKKASALVLIAVLLIVTVPFAVNSVEKSLQSQFQNAVENDITVGLTVKAYHPGQSQPFATRDLPNDVIVDQFNKFILDVFAAGSGITRAGSFATSSYTYAYSCSGGQTTVCGLVFEIGTGSVAAKGDTAMGTPYTPSGGSISFADTGQNPLPTASPANSVCHSSSTDYIDGMSGSQTITSSLTVSEAGAFLNTYSYGNFMIFHDVFVGISVNAGDTVTIAYQLNLTNAGFTDNFCNWMAAILTGNLSGSGYNAATYLTTGGASFAFYVWCSAVTPTPSVGYGTSGCGSASQAAKMAIGTGSSAFTPSTLGLTSQIGTYLSPTSDAYTSPVAYWTSTWTISGAHTISEAGMFFSLAGGTYMFFAVTFTGQAQSSGVPFGFTLRFSD